MKVTNCTGVILSCLVRRGHTNDKSEMYQAIDAHTSVEKQLPDFENAYFSVWEGKPNYQGTAHLPKLISDEGPYNSAHSFLLVDGGRKLLDFSGIRAKYIPGAASDGPAAPDPALAQGGAAAAAVLSALSTGFSATGPYGSVPAGFFSLLASMVLLAEDDSPEPPDLIQIQQVVERVVERVIKEELQQDNARKATSKFMRAQAWLLAEQRGFLFLRDQNSAAQSGDHKDAVAHHFIEELEGWAAPSSEFQFYMDFIRAQPEIAKWMIPAFISGIGAHLEIWRLHALVRKPVSADVISRFRAEVEMSREALVATARAWSDYCAQILRSEGLNGLAPWANDLIEELARAYVGTDNVGGLPYSDSVPDIVKANDRSLIGQALRSLDQVSKSLAEDLVAIKVTNPTKPMRHYWKESWNREDLRRR